MSEENVELIEISMEQAKSKIALMECIDRLTRNRDFKKIFTEGYFEKEPARLVKLKADPQAADPDYQASILKQIDSIGCLHQYLRAIHVQGQMAQRELVAHEEALEAELRGDNEEGDY